MLSTFLKRAACVSILISTIALAAGCHSHTDATVSSEPAPLDNTYIHRLERRAAAWRGQRAGLRDSATAAARKVIAGGHLYVDGPQKSFTWEYCGRSGGMMLSQPYVPNTPLQKDDTVVAAATSGTIDDELATLMTKAAQAGATIVLFGNTPPPGAPATSPSTTPAPLRADCFTFVDPPSGDLPIDSLSNVIGMWAWTGEFISACLRDGHMPRMYESNGMPDGKVRNTALGGRPFHDHANIEEFTDADEISLRYLNEVEASLHRLGAINRDAFVRAANLLRTARSGGSGATVRVTAVGHMFPAEIAVPASPSWMTLAKPDDHYAAADVALVLGYQAFPTEQFAKLEPTGCAMIVTCAHLPPLEFTPASKRVYINPCWQKEDAAVELRGYDVKILPMSGVMQAAIYWQLVELSAGN